MPRTRIPHRAKRSAPAAWVTMEADNFLELTYGTTREVRSGSTTCTTTGCWCRISRATWLRGPGTPSTRARSPVASWMCPTVSATARRSMCSAPPATPARQRQRQGRRCRQGTGAGVPAWWILALAGQVRLFFRGATVHAGGRLCRRAQLRLVPGLRDPPGDGAAHHAADGQGPGLDLAQRRPVWRRPGARSPWWGIPLAVIWRR